MGTAVAGDRPLPVAPPAPGEALDRLVGAVHDPTRRGILLAFHEDPHPRTVDEVASLVGVHRSVAFDHLEQLVRLGLLEKTRRRGRVGKPAGLYHLGGGALEAHWPPRQHAMLAALLAQTLGDLGARGRRRARETGVRLGEHLAVPGSHGVGEALRPLEDLGGVYSVAGDVVTARNCLFQEPCASACEVVCGLHGGIIEGLLRAAGIPATVTPCPTDPPGCAYRLGGATAPAPDQAWAPDRSG